MVDYRPVHKLGIHLIAFITSHTVKQCSGAGVLITFSQPLLK